jgi:hypothetical protein
MSAACSSIVRTIELLDIELPITHGAEWADHSQSGMGLTRNNSTSSGIARLRRHRAGHEAGRFPCSRG